MMMSCTFSEVVREAGRLGQEVRYVKGEDVPRFELYAFAGSICSEKVRCTLLALGYPFVERRLEFFYAQTYHPAYVRLRTLAHEKMMTEIDWDGSTSATVHGVDPLVVPTLVDLRERRVVVDSRRIVDYLDPKNLLRTLECKEQLDIVDSFPHLGLLYGGTVEDRRPLHLRLMLTPSQHGARMLKAQMRYRDKAPEDLRSRYDAKIEKTTTCFAKCSDENEQRAAERKARAALVRLNDDIPTFNSSSLSAADITWFVTLYRLQLLGMLPILSKDLDHVLPYFHSLFRYDALKNGVVTVDGQVPSHHVIPLIYQHLGFLLAAKNLLVLCVATADAILRYLLSSNNTTLLLLLLGAAGGLAGSFFVNK